MNQVKQIHAHTIRNGIDQSKFLIQKLLEFRDIPYARALFDLLPNPTTFLYNKLLYAYVSHGLPLQCFPLYSQMRLRACPLNCYSFTFLFTACAVLSSARNGLKLHSYFLKQGFQFDAHVFTSLLDMYAKSGFLTSARQLFDEMPQRDVPAWNSIIAGYARSGKLVEARDLFDAMPAKNVVSWTTLISGYSQNGRFEEALEIFTRMEEQNVRPNEVTVTSILPACGNFGALELGERIDRYAREHGFLRNVFVGNSLLEMYAKCGKIDCAKQVFEEMAMVRNLCSWNSMIMGMAVHGRWQEGLELFQSLLSGGTAPDDITFVGVLLACTHGGLVDLGWDYFDMMEKEFSLNPKLEHYGCMVDLLGRAGLLNEAYSLISSMPMEPDSVVWGALLGACSFFENLEFAEIAAEFLFKLEPWNPGNYVILSNVYASCGRWDGVAKVRMQMKGNLMKKAAGWSSVETGGSVHKFFVEDRSHPNSGEIFSVLEEITSMMKLVGYVPDLDLELESHE